ncbi:MAG: protein kinase [Oligosphaeraceae bacterium]|nr:protein kinase [Oligosphaeraceae bacterium]
MTTHWGRQEKREILEDLVVNPVAADIPTQDIDTAVNPEIAKDLPPLQPHYESLKVLAQGSQGIVSIALDKQLGRLVALKTMHRDLSKNPHEVKLFVAEAKITAQLDHPAIIPLYSLNSDAADSLHLAMKLVRGKTLREYLENIICNYRLQGIDKFDEHSSLFKRLGLFLKVCEAISYAHHSNVIHCDLKPENIMIGEFSEVFVMDWGIAKKLDHDGRAPATDSDNMISGTPRYLSPETMFGELLDVRSDIFSLGLILHEVVTLSFATAGDTPGSIMNQIKGGQLEPVQHAFGVEIAADLAAIIRTATAHAPDQRYQTVSALADDLNLFIQGREVQANPDNWFMKMVRVCHQHRVGVFISLLLLLTLSASLFALVIHQQLLSARTANFRSEIINAANSHCTSIATQIDRVALNIENLVSAAASQAAFLLDEKEENAVLADLLTYHDGEPEKIPEDLRDSLFYRQPTSLQYGLYKGAKDTPPAVLEHEIRILSRLLPYFKRSILVSAPGTVLHRETLPALQEQMLAEGMPMKSMFLGTRNGSYMVYPWRDNYRKPFDPRVRPWYLLARDAHRPVWGRPYVGADISAGLSLPCSQRITGADGAFYGVLAMDCTFNKITSLIRTAGPLANLAEEVALTDAAGQVIISSNSPFFGAAAEIEHLPEVEPEMPYFGSLQLRQTILNRKFGSLTQSEQGQDKIYSFAFLPTWNWYLIVKIDFKALANLQESQSRREPHALHAPE